MAELNNSQEKPVPKPAQQMISSKGLVVQGKTISWWWIALVILVLIVAYKWNDVKTMFNNIACAPAPGSSLGIINPPQILNNLAIQTPEEARKLVGGIRW
jgi:hypothetical protein